MNECPLVPQPVLPRPYPQHLHPSIPSALYLPLDFLSYSFKASQSSISELKSLLNHLFLCVKSYPLIVE